jgi:hypothetical protein
MGVISCLPAFYLSKSLIEKYGHYKILLFAQIAMVIRLLLNSTFDPLWKYATYALLATQLLHGYVVNILVFFYTVLNGAYIL